MIPSRKNSSTTPKPTDIARAPSESRGSIEIQTNLSPETYPMMRRISRSGWFVLLLIGSIASGVAESAELSGSEKEQKLIAVLKSDAPLKDKADACRELS